MRLHTCIIMLITTLHTALLIGYCNTSSVSTSMCMCVFVFEQRRFKTVALGFSAKTSAAMTQDIIDGKLDKRRKGVYGPPLGQQAIVFVDDMNLPEVETYGAQPPLELLRQMIDAAGWYSLREMKWQTIVDTTILGSMGPQGNTV
jgi:dynein heavy chain, axonemal